MHSIVLDMYGLLQDSALGIKGHSMAEPPMHNMSALGIRGHSMSDQNHG